jgi:hypothetical protein
MVKITIIITIENINFFFTSILYVDFNKKFAICRVLFFIVKQKNYIMTFIMTWNEYKIINMLVFININVNTLSEIIAKVEGHGMQCTSLERVDTQCCYKET